MCTPEECSKVYLWLVSKGVNVARVQQKAPGVMIREIRAVQSTFEALQQAAAFSDKQMCTLLQKHSVALASGPERVLGTLQVVSTILGMPMTSDSFREVVLAASSRLFFTSPDTIHQRVTFFLPDVCHRNPCSQDSAHKGCLFDFRGCDAKQSSKPSRAAGLGQ